MDTLINLGKNIPELVMKHIELFDSFEYVYLFGSVLKPEIDHNDLDILAIYIKYQDGISKDALTISDKLEKVSGLVVDLTVLSIEEEKDTGFLEKIKSNCLRIK